MKLLLLFGAAIALVVLGARGTYKAVWNSFFPNEPITTTPVSTLPSLAGVAPSTSNTTGGQPGQTATNPVQVGQQAGTATKNWIGSLLGQPGNNSGGSNTMAPGTKGNNSNVPSVSVPSGKQAVVNTGIPSWWPSWLPYPGSILGYPGAGYQGQTRNIP